MDKLFGFIRDYRIKKLDITYINTELCLILNGDFSIIKVLQAVSTKRK